MDDISKQFIEIPATFYFSNQRAKLCGFHLELSRYGRDLMVGNKGYTLKDDKEKTEKPVYDKLTEDEVRKKNMLRAKNNVTDLIHCNVWQWSDRKGNAYMPIFITFTFAENITDLTFAHKKFTDFIRRFGYDIRGKMTFLKYLVVVEFQERGAIHYHVVFFNLTWIDRIYDKVIAEWRKGVGEGSACVESMKSEYGLVDYLCKYLTKSVEGGRLQARKSYFTSKGLKKPLIHSFDVVVDVIRKLVPERAKLYSYHYEHDFLKFGDVDCYNLRKYPAVFNKVKVDILEKYSHRNE